MEIVSNSNLVNMEKYTINDFCQIKDSGFTFDLPDKTLQIISQIAELVGDASYIKTPVFKKKIKIKKTETPYKSTILKKETLYDEEMCNIKSNINKLTNENYELIVTSICESLDKLIDAEEKLHDISNLIFNRVSTNGAFVKVYAKLYAYLMGNYEIFEKILESTLPDYIKLFDMNDHNKLLVSSNDNYEEFCNLMREHENRRSLSKFISCMLVEEVIDKKFIINIINTLNKKLLLLANLEVNEGAKAACDVISDNIKIFILDTNNIIIKSNEWNKIKRDLDKVLLLDNKTNFTKKSKFKFYDINDYLKKNNL